MKICLVSSGGGHLYQLWQLRKSWQEHECFWISYDSVDARSLLKDKLKYHGYFPDSRNLVNGLKNLILALKIFGKEKPDMVISAGAGLGVAFLLMAKLMGIKTVYIEPIDFVGSPSLSGILVNRWVDLFLVQNKEGSKFFSKAKYWGRSI